jgi:hypothetical protein
LGTGSSANLRAGFDETLYVGSSLIDLGNCPSVCRDIRGNPIAGFGLGFETMCIGLIAGISVLGVPLSPHDTNAEPIECMELMAIAAVEVGSNIHRKLLDDLEKKNKK